MQFNLGRALLIVIAITTGAIIVWSLKPRPIEVNTAKVTVGRFIATVDEDGKTRVQERYVVDAPLAGRLLRIALKAGDRVTQGSTIATILPTPVPFLDPRARRETEERLGAAEAARERASAEIERARAEASQAQNELVRVQTLVQRGVSAKQALERAETTARVTDRQLSGAEFQSHAAEHAVAQAKALLQRYDQGTTALTEAWSVTAPVSGQVLKILQESEAIVAPGTPLLAIGDPRALEIVVDVLSSDAVEIKPGADVLIERWGGQEVLDGRVRRVEPSAFTKISTLGVEEQRTNVIVDFASPPELWAGLGDGYRVEARITKFVRDNVTIVPAVSLFRTGDTWNVYVVIDGRAESRAVEVLRQSGRWAAITSGLTAGEAVIVYPSDSVRPGVRVEQAKSSG